MAALAFSGLAIEVCGVEPDIAGLRVYVGARYLGRYFLVRDPQPIDRVKYAWAASYRGHLIMDRRELPYLFTEYRATTRGSGRADG
jgi:hypothetical protein